MVEICLSLPRKGLAGLSDLALDVVHGLEADHLSNAEDQEPRRDGDQAADDGGPESLSISL